MQAIEKNIKKIKILFISTAIFQVIFILLFLTIIKLDKIFSMPIVESIYEFTWIGSIILGIVSSYIGYDDYKKLSFINTVFSFMLLILYILSTLISCM